MRAVAVVAFVPLALAGCGSGSKAKHSAAPSSASVSVADFKFGPPRVEVAPGGRVTFTNRDRAPHTATASGAFDTGVLHRGASRTVRVTKPGTYSYVCQLHPFMRGTVVVTMGG